MTIDLERSDFLGLAKENCAQCRGLGLRRGGRTAKEGAEKKTPSPCNCVLRAIFRACYSKFRYCAGHEKHISSVRLEQVNGSDCRQTWGMKDEEYMADFYLVTKRHLEAFEYKIFKFHFLLGADWKLCCRQMKMERGDFFHAVYRIQQKLGKVFLELKPYALFPLDEYFGGAVRKELPAGYRKLVEMPIGRRRRALVPPLRKVA